MDSAIEFYSSSANRKISDDVTVQMCQTHSEYIDSAMEAFLRVGMEKHELKSQKEKIERSKGLTVYSHGQKIIIIDMSKAPSQSEQDRIIFHELGHAGTADMFKTCFVSSNDFKEHAGYSLLKEFLACYDSNICMKTKYGSLSDDVYEDCVNFFMDAKANFMFSYVESRATALGECLSVMIIFFEEKLLKDSRLNGKKIKKTAISYAKKSKITVSDCRQIIDMLF